MNMYTVRERHSQSSSCIYIYMLHRRAREKKRSIEQKLVFCLYPMLRVVRVVDTAARVHITADVHIHSIRIRNDICIGAFTSIYLIYAYICMYWCKLKQQLTTTIDAKQQQ